MFKNRTFQIRMVDNTPHEPSRALPPAQPVDVVGTVGTVATSIMAIIGTYMVADTVRKSVIHVVSTKVK